MGRIIIGGGIAGVSSALSARKQNREDEIILLEKEKYVSYLRGNLPYIISDSIRNYGTIIPTIDYFIKNRINILLSSFVKKIDLNNKKIIFIDPEKHERVSSFTKIIVTTGTVPVKLNVGGHELNDIFELRTIEDAIKIKESVMKSRKVVIIGGGPVALKTAEVLLKKKCKIIIISPEKEILYKIFDENFGQILREKIEKSGIKIITENKVRAFYGKGSGSDRDRKRDNIM